MFRKYFVFSAAMLATVSVASWFCDAALAAKLDPTVCANLARGKAYKEASSCFLRIANSLNKPKLTPVERKLKGLYLNNAAKLMARTAGQQKEVHVKAYYNEQAANMYKTYLREKLCTQQYRCQEISGKLYGLINAINYAQFNVVIGPDTKGKVSFEGYEYKQERSFPPNISLKLRPGKYRLIIEYDNKKTEIKNVELKPGKTEIMTLKAPEKKVIVRRAPVPKPKPKASAPVWAWVVLGVGIAALAVSPVMFGLGASEAAGAVERRNEYLDRAAENAGRPPNVSNEDIRDAHDDVLVTHEMAQTFFTVGWILGGVGAAAIVVGVVGLATAKPKAPPATTALPKSRDNKLVFERFSF